MVEKYNIRTDLALEEQERFESDDVEIQGVVLEENYDEACEMRITKVVIETENGAKMMEKPVGTYITMEAPNLAVMDENYHKKISKKLMIYLRELIQIDQEEAFSVLVVGLGNRYSTPDALGPFVADHLSVTRHFMKEYGKYAFDGEQTKMVSAIVPGVMGQTGMESLEIVKGIVNETKPNLVIAVDALAARNSRRLNRTIQISDTGIYPGAGVGNYRRGLTEETVGVPVIGIGVPTVVDAATIASDTMENLIIELEKSDKFQGVGKELKSFQKAEKYDFLNSLLSPHLNGMFVTPKDEDEMISQISLTIADALNALFQFDGESSFEKLS